MQSIDQIIIPKWLIPVSEKPSANHDSTSQVLKNQAVAIDKGRIVEVGASEQIKEKYNAIDTVELVDHILSPGLVNAHTHSAMSLLRGYADDLPLNDWLSDHIWPAEAKWIGRDFIRAGTDIAIAEMLLSGTTCFNDMYFFPDVTAAQAEKAGIRACVGMIVIEFPSAWASNAEDYFNKGLEMRDALRHSQLVTTSFAPHAPYTVSDQSLEKIRILADELDCQIHIHVHETAHEIEESNARFGMRPLERLDQLGLVSPRLAAVHMTQLLPAEIEVLAERGVNVIHCPQSNLKLASGLAPISDMLSADINVAIGTDGASSNNDLDMLAETQTASLLAKGQSGNPSAMDAYTALYSATMGGAVAMGIDQKIGSLEAGKAADMIAIDLADVATQPVFNPLSLMIYSACRQQVSDVWVAGKRLVNNRKLTQMDVQNVIANAKQWGRKISQG